MKVTWLSGEARLADDKPLLSAQQLQEVRARLEALGAPYLESVSRYVGIAKYPQHLSAEEAERFLERSPKL